ncbi:MAG TPA: hypothetical protein VJT50_05895 [Pyrinomonadaceae bacterium]|nr:hypothetical protein [Pyrinomonadaceae bacterium]
MKQYNLCFLGFGKVGRALVRLLQSKSQELKETYGIAYRITGIASRTLGWQANNAGFDSQDLLQPAAANSNALTNIHEWLSHAKPNAVFETTSLQPETGQPAIDYERASLQADAHVITANKGVVVYGFRELNELARSMQRCFLFEASVLDSAPVFSLFRETLPAAKLRAFAGVFSSTTNVILETMEAGRSFGEGLKSAQELGVTETDPAHDIDGWDATMKVCALANVLMNVSLKPADVARCGIRDLTPQQLQRARSENKPFKLIARARTQPDGTIAASVRPEQIGALDPLATVRGTSLAIHFELDMMPGLTITSHRPNLQSTAYGLLADFINAVRNQG